MKKEWKAPELEILNVRQTMSGPGKAIPDEVHDDDEHLNYS